MRILFSSALTNNQSVFEYQPTMSNKDTSPVTFVPTNIPAYLSASGTAKANAKGPISVTVNAYYTPAGGAPTLCGSTTVQQYAEGENHYTLPTGCLELLANSAPLPAGTTVTIELVAGNNTTLEPGDYWSITVLELETYGTH